MGRWHSARIICTASTSLGHNRQARSGSVFKFFSSSYRVIFTDRASCMRTSRYKIYRCRCHLRKDGSGTVHVKSAPLVVATSRTLYKTDSTSKQECRYLTLFAFALIY